MSKSKPFIKDCQHQVDMWKNIWNITGMTFQKFAEICNCSVESVKEIVEKKPLTMKLAKKIEKELDIPADLLMSIEEDYRSRIKPVVKLKTREKKTPVVKQSYAVANN